MTILKSLNPTQQEAVRHTEGPLLIVAGAGSGKTRVLIHRIAYLIKEKNVSPLSILAVTFTNKAANEMKYRLKKILGAYHKNMWVGTFHSVCGRILRKHIQVLGWNPNFIIFDEDDQLTLMKEVLKEAELSEKKFKPWAVLEAISRAKNEIIDFDQYARRADGFFEENVAIAYRLYQEKLLKNNAIDFYG
jgi:DNA helicase II / ATP-dependent DNA helicase PcrA